jgi:hypothetical protein
VVRETDDGLELNNGIEIIVLANSFRSIRGRTVLCCIFDECAYWRSDESAYWRSDESANPDRETYSAIIPAMVTLPDAMLIGISTVYRKSGLLYEKWRDHYGKDDPDVLVIRAATRQFNPTIPESFIREQIERDPEVAGAEWLSEWRSDLSDYVLREVIEGVVDPGINERPALLGVKYTGFVDPSGGSGTDSMTLAIAHREQDGTAVLDLVRERRPKFSPSQVVAEFAGTLHAYRVARVWGDAWGGEFVKEPFRAHQIIYDLAKVREVSHSKSAIYRDVLPMLNSGRVRLLDNNRLVS